MVQSDVARLMEQIEEETHAMKLGLSGIAQVASHEFISRKFQMLDSYHNQLKNLVGEEQATLLTCNVYNQVMTTEQPYSS